MADDIDKEENEQNNQENQRIYSRWQARQKINKLNQFHLSKEEKYLIRANDNELRDLVIKELTKNIEEIGKKIDLINKSKKEKNAEDISSDKKKKKNLITKIQKLKKCLKDEGGINARIKLLKQKARKLRSTKKKVEENLGNLKNSFKRCLNCKKRGHLVEDCPFKQNNVDENNDNNNNDVICYNCGSYDHTLYKCDKPIDYNNLPYALCFRCNKRGHISANCPDNENGIYVHGGSCFVCGAKDHLAKNCPEKQAKEEAYKVQKPKKNDKKEKKKKKFSEDKKEKKEENKEMNDIEEDEKDEEKSDKE